jgi:hypothetical protein
MAADHPLLADLLLLHGLLGERGIPCLLAYGALLGAIRDGALIPWDDDLDFLARPEDRDALLALDLAPHGLTVTAVRYPASHLAERPRGLRDFDGGLVRVLRDGRKLADFFLFTPFSDGVARRYDLATEVYWSPHMSFPSFHLDPGDPVRLGGVDFPAPRGAERWLEIVYGRDWRVPRRNRAQGGVAQRNRNIYGHRIVPHLRADLRWCREQGWDPRGASVGRPKWPRAVRGAGPIGPTPRTEDNSRALWWRDVDELVRHF